LICGGSPPVEAYFNDMFPLTPFNVLANFNWQLAYLLFVFVNEQIDHHQFATSYILRGKRIGKGFY